MRENKIEISVVVCLRMHAIGDFYKFDLNGMNLTGKGLIDDVGVEGGLEHQGTMYTDLLSIRDEGNTRPGFVYNKSDQ